MPSDPAEPLPDPEAVLPPAFLDRLRQQLSPGDLSAVLAAFRQPRAPAFRVNTLRAEPAAVEAELTAAGLTWQAVPWLPAAYRVPPAERAALLASAACAGQRIYVQNLASMVPVVVLAPEPGERVLDLAAAPGSKTLQIACRMRGEGELAAVEVVRSRFFKLQHNLEAQGATHVRTYLQDGTRVWRYRPEYFDRVLLDAPCSSEGRFHVSDPASYAYWSPRKSREMARKQVRLLYSAVQSLRPGGVLVYATCSLAPDENEAVLDKTLRTFGEALTLEPIGLELETMRPPLQTWDGRAFEHDLSPARRLLPGPDTEGFFVARLRKKRSTLTGRNKP